MNEGVVLCVGIFCFILLAVMSYMRRMKLPTFQKYRELYPNLVEDNGTILCINCGSKKTFLHTKKALCLCATCGKPVYRTERINNI